jgi:regulator of protease activity HflC (stomatin/prohibitin superfamily)
MSIVAEEERKRRLQAEKEEREKRERAAELERKRKAALAAAEEERKEREKLKAIIEKNEKEYEKELKFASFIKRFSSVLPKLQAVMRATVQISTITELITTFLRHRIILFGTEHWIILPRY